MVREVCLWRSEVSVRPAGPAPTIAILGRVDAMVGM